MATKDVVQLTPQEERATLTAAELRIPVQSDGRIVEGQTPRETSGMSATNIRKLSRLAGLDKRMRIAGIAPATILNMNPYQLKLNSTLVGDIIVPPCESGKKYSVVVLRDYRVSWETTEDGDGNPIPWVPVHMAAEFEAQYYNNGGVMVYQGDGLAEDPEETFAKNPKLKQNYEAAKRRQIGFAEEMVRQGNSEWNTPNRQGSRNITNVHRACALLLHDFRGQELPPWMDKIPGQYGLGTQCPRCKAIPQTGAYMCRDCGYWLDPEQAYLQGEITATDVSLARLTREKLNELGISTEDQPETMDERKAKMEKAKQARLNGQKGAAIAAAKRAQAKDEGEKPSTT